MKTMSGIFTVSILVLLSVSSSAFTNYPNMMKSPALSKNLTVMHASKYDDIEKKIGMVAVAALFVLSNAFFPEEALAKGGGGGRSGGSGGGRASVTSSSKIMSKSSRVGGRASATSAIGEVGGKSKTVIVNSSPTIIAPPSAVVASSPFGYNSLGGLGVGIGINAIENVGREIREQGQERELRDNRAELQQTKFREQELEQRLRMLEMQQK